MGVTTEIKFMLSENGKSLIIFNSYKFKFQKQLKDDVKRWPCCKNSCNLSIKLNEKKGN